MTKVIIESNNEWASKKIASTLKTEARLLKKVIQRTRDKLRDFEKRYGKFNRERLYGKVDDMVLLEWEGEREVLERLEEKLKALEEITFEYKRVPG